MLENLGISKRSLSLEDAASYLSEQLRQPVFTTDLMILAKQKNLKLSCYVNGVAGRKITQYCKPNINDHLREVFPLTSSSSLSYLSLAEPSQRVIKNLKGEKWETSPITPPERHDSLKGALFRANNNLSSLNLPHITGFGRAVWLEGLYEIVITQSFQKWLVSAVSPSPLFDLDDFTLTDERGELVKIVGYSSGVLNQNNECPHQALVRLEVLDLKVQLQHIQEFLKNLEAQKANTSKTVKSKTSYLGLRKIVAQVYVDNKTQDYMRTLSTVELWKELYQTAQDMAEPEIDAERLFKQKVQNNTIEKVFVELRNLGVPIPVRR